MGNAVNRLSQRSAVATCARHSYPDDWSEKRMGKSRIQNSISPAYRHHMNQRRLFGSLSTILVLISIVLMIALLGCRGGGTESGEGGDEESGTQFGLSDTFDEIRAGARLIFSYDSAANAFTGTVENTTNDTLRRVRLEVHLSNGAKLGPTTPVDLAPGQVGGISFLATSQPFTSWSVHAEVD